MHPAIEAAEHTVRGAIRRQHLSTAAARRAIRVEVSSAIGVELIAQLEPGTTTYFTRHRFAGRQPRFPCEIRGVTYYEVEDLPAPGWRIVDPFAED